MGIKIIHVVSIAHNGYQFQYNFDKKYKKFFAAFLQCRFLQLVDPIKASAAAAPAQGDFVARTKIVRRSAVRRERAGEGLRDIDEDRGRDQPVHLRLPIRGSDLPRIEHRREDRHADKGRRQGWHAQRADVLIDAGRADPSPKPF